MKVVDLSSFFCGHVAVPRRRRRRPGAQGRGAHDDRLLDDPRPLLAARDQRVRRAAGLRRGSRASGQRFSAVGRSRGVRRAAVPFSRGDSGLIRSGEAIAPQISFGRSRFRAPARARSARAEDANERGSTRAIQLGRSALRRPSRRRFRSGGAGLGRQPGPDSPGRKMQARAPQGRPYLSMPPRIGSSIASVAMRSAT